MWYVLSYVLSFCKCEKEIEFDAETIEVLRAIYQETDDPPVPPCPSSSEDESEDEDYAPPEDVSDDDGSDTDTDSDYERPDDEEIIIKKDKEGNFYIY